MDFLQKIGGRKFIMALIAIGAATFIELKHPAGLSATMAGFLGSIVAAFSVANFAVTKTHMNRGQGKGSDSDVSEKLDQLLQANSPEAVSTLTEYLAGIKADLDVVKSTHGQIGAGVLNLNKEVQSLKRG